VSIAFQPLHPPHSAVDAVRCVRRHTIDDILLLHAPVQVLVADAADPHRARVSPRVLAISEADSAWHGFASIQWIISDRHCGVRPVYADAIGGSILLDPYCIQPGGQCEKFPNSCICWCIDVGAGIRFCFCPE